MTGKAAGHIHPEAESASPDTLEVSPGWEHEKLEGWVPGLASEEETRKALEKAFDYRGDEKRRVYGPAGHLPRRGTRHRQ